MEMALSRKPWIVCMTGEGILNLEVIQIFQIFSLCITLASGASQKKIKRRKNNLWTPSLTHQISTQDPTSDKSQGGGGGVRTPGPPSGSTLDLTVLPLEAYIC